MAAALPVRRDRLLKVMGVTPWRLRGASVVDDATTAGAANETAPGVSATADVACVVILPVGASGRELDMVGRALRAFGPITARAARLEAGPAGLRDVPVAAAYLVFGEAQARALGHVLPAAVLNAAQIVLVDTPAAIVGEPAAKRRLFNALRAVGRTLARR